MASSFTPQSLWAQDHNPGTHLTGSWVNCSTVLDHAKKRSTPNCCTDYKSDYPVVQSDGSFVHKLSFSNYPLLKCSCWSAHGNYFPFPPPRTAKLKSKDRRSMLLLSAFNVTKQDKERATRFASGTSSWGKRNRDFTALPLYSTLPDPNLHYHSLTYSRSFLCTVLKL